MFKNIAVGKFLISDKKIFSQFQYKFCFFLFCISFSPEFDKSIPGGKEYVSFYLPSLFVGSSVSFHYKFIIH